MDSGSVFWFIYVSWNQVELLLLAGVSVTILVILLVVFSPSCDLTINAFRRLYRLRRLALETSFLNAVDIQFIYTNTKINKKKKKT